MRPQDREAIEQLRQVTGHRLGLRTWAGVGESITSMVVTPAIIKVQIDTYDVQVMVREDRFKAHGTRTMLFTNLGAGWSLEADMIEWDDAFTPYVYEKVGRRKTAEEFTESREWSLLCHRPGTGRFPLDSYDRVLDPSVRSTDKMERYW